MLNHAGCGAYARRFAGRFPKSGRLGDNGTDRQPLESVRDGLGRSHRARGNGLPGIGRGGGALALVGGQAVALWVASRVPAAVRTTKDVDILVCTRRPARARAAALAAGMDYFEVMGVGSFSTGTTPIRVMPSTWSGPAKRSGRNTNSHRPRFEERRGIIAGASSRIVSGPGGDEAAQQTGTRTASTSAT